MRTLPLLVLPLLLACSGADGGADPGPTPPPPPPAPGSIHIVTSFSGFGHDDTGYILALDGGAPFTLGPTDSVLLSNIPVGDHTIALSDIAPTCRLAGDSSRTVAIASQATSRVGFVFTCYQPFSNEILAVEGGHLWRINPTTGLQRFALDTAGSLSSPAPSPNGMRFAYVHGGTLAVADPDGRHSQDLVVGCVEAPAWSPDGQSLVYSCRDSTASDLYIVAHDGGTPINITSTPGVHEESPSWSPDGTRIAFEVNDPGGGLFTIQPDGANRHQLTFEAADEGAVWSPDGSHIAFLRWVGQVRPVYVMNSNGSGEIAVTGDPDASNMYTHYSPSWSPDGQSLAFTRYLGASYDIFRIQANGTGLLPVTHGGIWTDVHWSR